MTDLSNVKWNKPVPGSPLAVYVIYDRSGSMASKQAEAVPAINRYVSKLDKDTVITVVAFDSQDPHEVVRDHVLVKDFVELDIDEVNARGMTPLYDCVGWVIDHLLADNPKRAVLVIQTDGEENFSREYTFAGVKALIDRLTAKEYQTIFLGAEFKDVGKFSTSMGFAGNTTTLNMNTRMYASAADSLASKTRGYATSGMSMSFNAAEKMNLGDRDTIVDTVGNNVVGQQWNTVNVTPTATVNGSFIAMQTANSTNMSPAMKKKFEELERVSRELQEAREKSAKA